MSTEEWTEKEKTAKLEDSESRFDVMQLWKVAFVLFWLCTLTD